MTGFHANDSSRCSKFISEPDYLIIDANDTDFLGSGMYFWEHQSRAEWWSAEKNKPSIVKAELDLSSVLDLTDDEKLHFIEQVADKFTTSMNRRGIKPRQIGLKLNYLFEAYKPLSEMYGSIRARFYYDRKDDSPFLFGSKLTAKCVDIYCIRHDCRLVTQRQWVRK